MEQPKDENIKEEELSKEEKRDQYLQDLSLSSAKYSWGGRGFGFWPLDSEKDLAPDWKSGQGKIRRSVRLERGDHLVNNLRDYRGQRSAEV